MKSLWASVQGDPVFMRKVNGWLALCWFLAAFPSMLTGIKNSVAYLVFLSIYAIVTGHWASWQAARVEVKQDEAEST